jgi:hypothetical protein
VFWALSALVAVMIVGGIAVFANSGGSGKPKNNLPAQVQHPGSTPKSPTPSDTAVPNGFRLYKDDTGFTTVVPQAWSDNPRRGDGDMVIQNGTSRIVFHTYSGAASALDALRSRGDGGQAQYTQLRIGGATAGPLADPSGVKSAEVEYTWESNAGKQHVLVRDFEANGHTYEIQIRAPEGSWAATLQQLGPVIARFQPTG